ncbi:conserved hypothetical protein [Thermosulfidibacter takaii ABI70S6]|uniref:MEMO1 family protein TST_0713 n=1 Tax=Thermosulfidibacter takaii (strain DSM 17441 / JCM 13301 / NBRC 103674 / ABI70S6) TaxID=1298851 RepID=A0A0S3QT70_THET7|nr:AmmeMemoRadiSam system protein B [Thermosulfidibacter takaii]BAT71518.1 conserved hypothetical protein [Thermosulfidibacter takaii ABI70S6]
MMVRKPAVAGYFYPKDPIRLLEMIQNIAPKFKGRPTNAIAVVSPHAGYMYSGYVAAEVYSRVIIPENIVILGPNHTGLGAPISVMNEGIWMMPLGEVSINEELANSILEKCSYAEADYTAHLGEHSIEVQIPLIQYFRRDIKIVPIVIGTRNFTACTELGIAIAESIKELGEKTLIVASTDFTHYEDHKTAAKKDELAVSAILKLNPAELYRVVHEYDITMCGVMPTVATLTAAIELGATEAELVKYMTSGDITGDYQQVVGYAGIIIK